MRSASLTSPETVQPESPLTADLPHRRAGLFDYRHAINTVDVNLAAGLMDPSLLCVGSSIYMGMRDGEFADIMGDALSASVTIEAGTLIATFTGTRISRQAARNIPHGENNYLISMQDGTVLDCRENATIHPPACLASISNQADGAYHAPTRRILTYDDNNAYVVWRLVLGVMVATLYAVRRIVEGEEIMWSYGPSFAYGFDASTVYSTSSSEPSFGSDSTTSRATSRALSPDPLASAQPVGARGRLLAVHQRLRALGFTHGEDAYPEYGFSNASPSTISESSSVNSRRLFPPLSPVPLAQSPPSVPGPSTYATAMSPAEVEEARAARRRPLRRIVPTPADDRAERKRLDNEPNAKPPG
jgi:hypothetical protein